LICLNICILCTHGNNSFAEEFKNLVRYRSENIFANRQSNYVEPSSVDDNIAKRFNILAISLSYIILFLHSILMVQAKLISVFS